MPSPRTALRTASVQLSGWSRWRAGTPRQICAWLVSRLPVRTRGPAGRVGAGAKPGTTPLPVPNAVAGEPDRLVVRQVADDRDDRVGRPVGAPPEVVDGRLREGQDVRFLAADLATQRPVAEHRGLEQDLAVLGRIVEVRADLLDDHRPLALDVGVLEPRPDDQLADDVHRALGLAPRHAHPVDRRFAVGGGVERAADALDRLADRAGRRVGGRALEGEVLHEMGDADLAGRLEARPGQDVRGDRDRARRREPGADHAGPGWQRRSVRTSRAMVADWRRLGTPSELRRTTRDSAATSGGRSRRLSFGTTVPAGNRAACLWIALPSALMPLRSDPSDVRRGGESMAATRLRLLSLLAAAVVIFGACSNSAATPSGSAVRAAQRATAPGPARPAGADLQIPEVDRRQVQRRDGPHRAARRRRLEPGPLRGPPVPLREHARTRTSPTSSSCPKAPTPSRSSAACRARASTSSSAPRSATWTPWRPSPRNSPTSRTCT